MEDHQYDQNYERQEQQQQYDKFCFLCCTSKKTEKLRTSDAGIKTLSKQLLKFSDIGALDDKLTDMCFNENEESLEVKLSSARYHKTCYNNYNDKRLREVTTRKRKMEDEDQKPTSTKRLTRDTGQPKRKIGDLFCIFCDMEDDSSSLCAAGMLNSSESERQKHILDLTKEWLSMASFLEDDILVAKFCTGDVNSNEFYYHRICYVRFRNRYFSIKNSIANENSKDMMIKGVALAKIVNYLYECERDCPGNFYQVKSLEEKYLDLLRCHGVEYKSHVSHFSEILLEKIGPLDKTKVGGRLVVYFSSTIDELIHNQVKAQESFLRSLRDVVSCTRESLGQSVNKFNNNHFDSQESSVPIEILSLISTIIDGVSIENETFSQAALTVSQLIMFNFRVNKEKKVGGIRRHLMNKETPLAIYIALKLSLLKRSKTLIECLHGLGICISYFRLLSIFKDVADLLLLQFQRDLVFIPSVLHKNVFTVVAKDNIDINAKSSTAKKHFHGTGMTVAQWPSTTLTIPYIENLETQNYTSPVSSPFPGSKKIAGLPDAYGNVKTITETPVLPLNATLYLPVCLVVVETPSSDDSTFQIAVSQELEWLEGNFKADTPKTCQGWAQYHSNQKRSTIGEKGIHALLPLIPKEVHTIETQYHCMTIIKDTIEKLNPGQTPVCVSDQPVYKISKQIQILYPEKFGQGKYFVRFGDLHIEKSLLILHGDLIKGSGLKEILEANELSIVGADAIVNVNHIKKARYCMHVSMCALYFKLKEAYGKSGSLLPIYHWLKNVCAKQSVMGCYWSMIFEVQLQVSIFIRSLREGNFELYKISLWNALKWYFALDHFNYAKWLSLHLFDLLTLESYCPDVYEQFKDGKFVFQKTDREFSKMAVDQLHEQNNETIKGSGGAAHLVNREEDSGLLKWALCGPALARMVEDFEDSLSSQDSSKSPSGPKKHHEDTEAFRNRFFNDVQNVADGMTVNPFEQMEPISINNEQVIFPNEVCGGIQKLQSVGQSLFEEFWEKRLIKSEIPFGKKLDLNKIPLPGSIFNKEKPNKLVYSTAILNKIDSAVQHRRKLAEALFESEIFGIAQSIAETEETLYHSPKHTFLDRLRQWESYNNVPLTNAAIVIELSAMIQIYAHIPVNTFADFAKVLYQKIMIASNGYQRCDIICDRYLKNSIKAEIRESRRQSSRKIFSGATTFPKKFRSDFLGNGANKEDLNHYLATVFLDLHANNPMKLVVTVDESIISNDEVLMQYGDISSCTSEEADPRLVRHAINCAVCGYDQIIVRTVDTDVIVLLLGNIHHLLSINESDVRVLFGKGKNSQKYYNLNDIAFAFGQDVCKALPFQYAFTGCDTTSSFFSHGKCKWFDTWMSCADKDELTNTFIELSNRPKEIKQEHINLLETYVKRIYYPSKKDYLSINIERMYQFSSMPSHELKNIPISRVGLIEHTKRVCFQAGWCWVECRENVTLPNVEEWGRQRGPNQKLIPRWQLVDELKTRVDDVIFVCTCVKSLCKNCQCSRRKVKCLPFCKCQTNCQKAEQ